MCSKFLILLEKNMRELGSMNFNFPIGFFHNQIQYYNLMLSQILQVTLKLIIMQSLLVSQGIAKHSQCISMAMWIFIMVTTLRSNSIQSTLSSGQQESPWHLQQTMRICHLLTLCQSQQILKVTMTAFQLQIAEASQNSNDYAEQYLQLL